MTFEEFVVLAYPKRKLRGNKGSRYSDRSLRRWLPGLKLAGYSKFSRGTESKGVENGGLLSNEFIKKSSL